MHEESGIGLRRCAQMVWLLTLAHFLITSTLGITKILTFKTSFDLAVFNQIFWMIWQTGVPTITSQAPYHALHAFSWHFSPIFYLFSPIYNLFPNPLTLQIIHHVCISSSAILLFYSIRNLVSKPGWALLATAVYLLNPFMLYGSIWEFHESSLAMLWTALTLLGLSHKRKDVFLIGLLLLVLTKEQYGLNAAGFGLLWAIHHKDRRFGMQVAAAGVIAFFIILGGIMPALGNGQHPMLSSGIGDKSTARYAWLGTGILSAATQFADIFFTSHAPGFLYLNALLSIVLYLPLFALAYLASAAGDLLVNLLSQNPMPRLVSSYHSLTILPVLIFSAMMGLKKIQERRQVEVRSSVLVMLAAYLAMMTAISGLPFRYYELNVRASEIDERDVAEIKKRIGDGSVTAQPNIAFAFSGRPEIYPFRNIASTSSAHILYLKHPYKDGTLNPYNALYYTNPGYYFRMVKALLGQRPELKIAYWNNGWLLLKESQESDSPQKREEILSQLDSLVKLYEEKALSESSLVP